MGTIAGSPQLISRGRANHPFPPSLRRADFATMDRKLESNSYTALSEFTYDASLIFNNCRQYNDPGSNCAFTSSPLRPLSPCPASSRPVK